MRCKKCNSELPENSKFCFICGARVEPEKADQQKKEIFDRHYSLEEIAAEQNESANNMGVGADTPDDDPSTYLPPIGSKEHTEIPMGEITPNEDDGPLPPIEADDPLELAQEESEQEEEPEDEGDALPPIGTSDSMHMDTDVPSSASDNPASAPIGTIMYNSVGAAVPSMGQKQLKISLR